MALDDPEGRLEGDGNYVRSIHLDARASLLDDPYIRKLTTRAVTDACVDLKAGPGEIVLKSTLRASSKAVRAPR